jgi:hypothetical protein
VALKREPAPHKTWKWKLAPWLVTMAENNEFLLCEIIYIYIIWYKKRLTDSSRCVFRDWHLCPNP